MNVNDGIIIRIRLIMLNVNKYFAWRHDECAEIRTITMKNQVNIKYIDAQAII